MKIVEYNANSLEELVALDELLLNKAEAGEIGETLRFWTSEDYFVVVGRSRKVAEDCFLDRCRRDRIKIIRRVSGGGTVLQGPGCLNYSAILSYDRDKLYSSIRSSYQSILEKIAGALKERGFDKVRFFPLSDLALDNRKISGNAQARKRKFFLHHGTFLYDFDLEKVPLYLRHPGSELEYRKGRPHEDFLTNIPVAAEELEGSVRIAFSPGEGEWKLELDDREELKTLVSQKYSRNNWNYAF